MYFGFSVLTDVARGTAFQPLSVRLLHSVTRSTPDESLVSVSVSTRDASRCITGFDVGIAGSTGGGAPVILNVPPDTVKAPEKPVRSRISIVPSPTFETAPPPTRLPPFMSS